MSKRTIILAMLACVAAAGFAAGLFAFFYTKAHDIAVDPKLFTYLAMAGWASLIVTNFLSRRRKS